jgi:hypothetical protein
MPRRRASVGSAGPHLVDGKHALLKRLHVRRLHRRVLARPAARARHPILPKEQQQCLHVRHHGGAVGLVPHQRETQQRENHLRRRARVNAGARRLCAQPPRPRSCARRQRGGEAQTREITDRTSDLAEHADVVEGRRGPQVPEGVLAQARAPPGGAAMAVSGCRARMPVAHSAPGLDPRGVRRRR